MLTRLGLRALSLAAKFALTLLIAQRLGYAAVAQYGIAVAAAVIGTKVLGLGFSAECHRRLASEKGTAIADAIRLVPVHVVSYIVLAVVAVLLWQAGQGEVAGIPAASLALAIGAVVIAEHQAFEVNSYLFALHRTHAASWLLFMRTGLWAVLAVVGLVGGWVASMLAVLWLWIGSDLLVIACGWYLVRCSDREGREVHAHRLRSKSAGRLAGLWQAGAGFYVAAILLAGTQYTERLLGAGLLDAHALGHYVFLWAIANAVQTLVNAAVVTTAGPALARTVHDSPCLVAAVLKRQLLIALGLALAMAAGLWWGLDAVIALTGGHGDATDRTVFAILLASFVVRAVVDVEWVAAIALALRGATLQGMALVALAGAPLAWVLIRIGGMTGAALAHAALSLATASWLGLVLRQRISRTPASPASAAKCERAC